MRVGPGGAGVEVMSGTVVLVGIGVRVGAFSIVTVGIHVGVTVFVGMRVGVPVWVAETAVSVNSAGGNVETAVGVPFVAVASAAESVGVAVEVMVPSGGAVPPVIVGVEVMMGVMPSGLSG